MTDPIGKKSMIVRSAAACAALLAGCSSGDGAPRDVVFVANSIGGTVSVIDAEKLEVVRAIDITPDGGEPGEQPQKQAFELLNAGAGENFAQDQDISPDGRVLYVSRGHMGDVAAFDVKSGELLWRVPIDGFRADHMAISPDGGELFVSDIFENKVHVIDTGAHAIVDSFPTGTWSHDNQVSTDGERVYNASLGRIRGDDLDLVREALGVPAAEHDLEGLGIDPSTVDDVDQLKLLTVVEAGSREVVETHRFDRGVRPFELTEDEQLMYAQLSNFHGLIEYDLEAGEERRRLELPVSEEARQLEEYPFDAPHHGLAMSPDGERLCAAGRVSDYAAIVSRSRMDAIATVDVGDGPGWAITGPTGDHCYVASHHGGTVSVVRYEDPEELARITAGEGPKHMVAATVPASVL